VNVTSADLLRAEDELLSHSAAHANVDLRAHLLPRPAPLVLARRLHSASRDSMLPLTQQATRLLLLVLYEFTPYV
jgi:hypothetical protein